MSCRKRQCGSACKIPISRIQPRALRKDIECFFCFFWHHLEVPHHLSISSHSRFVRGCNLRGLSTTSLRSDFGYVRHTHCTSLSRPKSSTRSMIYGAFFWTSIRFGSVSQKSACRNSMLPLYHFYSSYEPTSSASRTKREDLPVSVSHVTIVSLLPSLERSMMPSSASTLVTLVTR